MTVISGSEYLTLNRYETNVGSLSEPWRGTIVALVIELANPLPLEDVYEEEVARIIPRVSPVPQSRNMVSTPASSLPVSTTALEQLPSTDKSPERRTLVVREFSTKLLARETGLAIRAELATLLVDGTLVEVDLDGVDDITPSVADECFGKLAVRMGDQKFRTRIVFRGGVPLLHRLIDFVVANRLKAQNLAIDDADKPRA